MLYEISCYIERRYNGTQRQLVQLFLERKDKIITITS